MKAVIFPCISVSEEYLQPHPLEGILRNCMR